eukprot:9516516-Ditylum_brightwellii.AAC.1
MGEGEGMDNCRKAGSQEGCKMCVVLHSTSKARCDNNAARACGRQEVCKWREMCAAAKETCMWQEVHKWCETHIDTKEDCKGIRKCEQ